MSFTLAFQNFREGFPTIYDGSTTTFLPKTVDLSNASWPAYSDFLPALWYCIALSIVRFVLQKTIFRKFALFCRGLEELNFKPNKTLDVFMSKDRSISENNIGNIAKVTNISEERIWEYVALRRKSVVIEKKVTKFIEALWRFLFYTSFVLVGARSMLYPHMQSWVTDPRQLFEGWPHHHSNELTYFYYMCQLGCYMHQLLWTEVARSDSLEMMTHHIITMTLVVISYKTNFTRIGSLIFILHDVSDIFLEVAKCFKYTSEVKGREVFQTLTDVFFGIFAILFFVTRLVMFPKMIIVTLWVYGYETFGCQWWGGWIFCLVLFCLQLLHIFWFYLIVRMIFRLFILGTVEKDVRSDDEEDVPPANQPAPIAQKKTKKA